MTPLRIGIIGDFNPDLRPHQATNAAVRHAADALSVDVEPIWIATSTLDRPDYADQLETCHALWAAPSSPYQSMEGALRGIRFARERDWPFVGT